MTNIETIINSINNISGRYSAYEVFSDWVRMMALSISNSLRLNHDKIWKVREDAYIDTAKRYTEKELTELSGLMLYLADELEEGPKDVLGDVYMRSGMGSKAGGQFFTPFHLSVLCAEAALDINEIREKEDYIYINEPSAGGGGMIIAAAKVLKDAGIDYQRRMRVVAQDIDWKSVYMCYVQLSLLGISAECVQINTLENTARPDDARILYTPARAGALI